MTAIVLGMKSLWIATGVVVGLGVAGLVAASTGGGSPSKIIGGDTVLIDDTTTTGQPASTTTTGGEVDVVSSSTTTSSVGGSRSTPTTAPRQIVTTPPAVAEPATEPLAPTTTAMPVFRTIGDPCEAVGLTWQDDSGQPLVCVAGSPNTWQRV